MEFDMILDYAAFDDNGIRNIPLDSMAPGTRSLANTSDDGVDDRIKRYVEDVVGVRSLDVNSSFLMILYLKTKRDAFIQRFGIVFDDPMAELKNVKYTSNAKEYQYKFDDLLSRVEVNVEHSVCLYLGGLPTELEIGLEAIKVSWEAMGTLLALPLNHYWLCQTLLKVRMLDQTPRKQLSQKEYEEKRSKNLCFYYDKKYVLGHKCEDQLFTLVVLADQEEQEEEFVDADENFDEMKTEEVQPQISLNALVESVLTKRSGNSVVIDLGDIKSNFNELKIEFVYNNKKMVQWVEREQRNDKVLEPELTQVIENFSDVFEVPHELPPKRNHDHRILLILGTPPVNIRPYRHHPIQKDAIEAMVKEFIDRLNKSTIKDKFPIPIIDELIDELHGVVAFSKLDLRSRCHQIRMFEDNIAKIAFRTHKGHYEFLVMPSGLTNAPFTCQALMNNVFNDYLRKFVLVFFDDILIYSKSISEHVEHLASILTTMRQNKLFAKKTKCVFGTSQVKYLGHVISVQGVATDPNASGVGIRAVLQQNGHLISYLSKALAPKHQTLSTYEKEFLAVMMALEKWRGYLLDTHFIIKTDHYNLKYLLDKRITTPTQMKWLPMLMGYDYEVTYKKGVDNAAADALSRLTKYAHFMPLSYPFTAARVAQEFLDTVYKLHGLPISIVSDRDKAVYGQPPLVYVPYLEGLSKVDAVDRTLEAREQAIRMLKFHLSRSQNRMQQQADKRRSDREGLLEPEPIALLDRKMVKKHNAVVVYRLVSGLGLHSSNKEYFKCSGIKAGTSPSSSSSSASVKPVYGSREPNDPHRRVYYGEHTGPDRRDRTERISAAAGAKAGARAGAKAY
nr:transposon Ty3-I Gag-Pol polyprotein [Tanacetum cinerariifolium]